MLVIGFIFTSYPNNFWLQNDLKLIIDNFWYIFDKRYYAYNNVTFGRVNKAM